MQGNVPISRKETPWELILRVNSVCLKHFDSLCYMSSCIAMLISSYDDSTPFIHSYIFCSSFMFLAAARPNANVVGIDASHPLRLLEASWQISFPWELMLRVTLVCLKRISNLHSTKEALCFRVFEFQANLWLAVGLFRKWVRGPAPWMIAGVDGRWPGYSW